MNRNPKKDHFSQAKNKPPPIKQNQEKEQTLQPTSLPLPTATRYLALLVKADLYRPGLLGSSKAAGQSTAQEVGVRDLCLCCGRSEEKKRVA